MPIDPAFSGPGRFYKGNTHMHSTRSDGARSPEEVCGVYRDGGYDFVSLTDHFLPNYGFPVTDTRPFRSDRFTTILGAELHAPATQSGELWHIVGVGLPLDFAPTSRGENGPALAQRAADAGAFLVLAHPGWYGLTMADADSVACAHALEIYNHKSQTNTDRGDGTYLADQLHVAGRHITLCAADDAHFNTRDYFGGFVMVKSADNDAESLVAALKAGAFYASQGPIIESVVYGEDSVEVACSPASVVMALGRGTRAVQRLEPGMTKVTLPLEQIRSGGFVRVVVVDAERRRAWTNPVWWPEAGERRAVSGLRVVAARG
jgi:histidinol phosphatase-like PHP family hydrolase